MFREGSMTKGGEKGKKIELLCLWEFCHRKYVAEIPNWSLFANKGGCV
jgi:hypothetical protein